MDIFKMILQILLAGAGVTILAVVRTFIKEVKQLIAVIKEAKEDGKIDDKEAIKIGKEAVDVFIEGVKLWNLIKNTFKGKLQKS